MPFSGKGGKCTGLAATKREISPREVMADRAESMSSGRVVRGKLGCVIMNRYRHFILRDQRD